jgi:hypothetical protein
MEAGEFMVANMAMTHLKMEVRATDMTSEMHQMISGTIGCLCNHWIFILLAGLDDRWEGEPD